MAFKLLERDHRTMDRHLDAVLNAYKDGKITLGQARASLAQVITAAVIDNEGEFKRYISLDPIEIFKDA